MKQQYSEKVLKYDGSQLKSLFAYLNLGITGNSIVAWQGPCDVSFDHMLDGEDLLDQSAIRGNHMLHFIIETFDRDLFSGVCMQRIFASLIQDYVQSKTNKLLKRNGDDLFLNNAKFSISIATKSPTSTLVHFAVNVTNDGTPVKTLSLGDLNLEAKKFAIDIMNLFVTEFESIMRATQKVKPVN